MNLPIRLQAVKPRRVLVINPNTNPLVTARVREVSQHYESAQLRFEVINPESGPFSIFTDEEKQHAEVHVLELIRLHLPRRHDAYVLACFDDLALTAARQMVSVPVIGCCEAGIAAARRVSPVLSIVTTLATALPGIRDMMRRYGAGDQASVRAAGVGVDEAARSDPDSHGRLMRTVEAAVQEDGARVILLASGGLTGQAMRISREAGVPVIDAVEAALRLAGEVPDT